MNLTRRRRIVRICHGKRVLHVKPGPIPWKPRGPTVPTLYVRSHCAEQIPHATCVGHAKLYLIARWIANCFPFPGSNSYYLSFSLYLRKPNGAASAFLEKVTSLQSLSKLFFALFAWLTLLSACHVSLVALMFKGSRRTDHVVY